MNFPKLPDIPFNPSRRRFFEFVVGGSVTTLVLQACGISKNRSDFLATDPEIKKATEAVSKSLERLTPEQQIILLEILRIRLEVLGLRSLPQGLEIALANLEGYYSDDTWVTGGLGEIPTDEESTHYRALLGISKQLLLNRGRKNISQVKHTDLSNFTYDPRDASIGIPKGLTKFSSEAARILVHETGHASDPENFKDLPIDMLLKLHLYKTRILSKSFDPNYESIAMLCNRSLFPSFGEHFIKTYLLSFLNGKSKHDLSLEEIQVAIGNFLQASGSEYMVKEQEELSKIILDALQESGFVFTKKVCFLIGQTLITRYLAKQINFPESDQAAFELIFDQASKESFAEFYAQVLLPDPKLNIEKDLEVELENFVSVYLERPVDIQVIRSEIKQITDDATEIATTARCGSCIHDVELTEVDGTFLRNTPLPTRESENIIKKYFKLTNKIFASYPGSSYHSAYLNYDFDPTFMHKWETDEVHAALHSPFVFKYRAAEHNGLNLSSDEQQRLLLEIRILEEFDQRAARQH